MGYHRIIESNVHIIHVKLVNTCLYLIFISLFRSNVCGINAIEQEIKLKHVLFDASRNWLYYWKPSGNNGTIVYGFL